MRRKKNVKKFLLSKILLEIGVILRYPHDHSCLILPHILFWYAVVITLIVVEVGMLGLYFFFLFLWFFRWNHSC